MTMTKKELAIKLEKFIKAHKPDEFKDELSAIRLFFNSLCLRSMKSVSLAGDLNYDNVISSWWWRAHNPMSEDEVLAHLDPNMVTHKEVECRMREQGQSSLGALFPDNSVEKLADWSFKYNIVKVEQKPGSLRVFFKESEDHQTNISGEVVEKIAKCLEF